MQQEHAESTEDAGLLLSELIRRIGDDHVLIQNLCESTTNVRRAKGGGVSISFYTRETSVEEIGGFVAPKMIGLVLWLPAEPTRRVQQEWMVEHGR